MTKNAKQQLAKYARQSVEDIELSGLDIDARIGLLLDLGFFVDASVGRLKKERAFLRQEASSADNVGVEERTKEHAL